MRSRLLIYLYRMRSIKRLIVYRMLRLQVEERDKQYLFMDDKSSGYLQYKLPWSEGC